MMLSHSKSKRARAMFFLTITGFICIILTGQAFAQNQAAMFDGNLTVNNGSRIRITDSQPIDPGSANPAVYQISGDHITVEAWVYPFSADGPLYSIVRRPAVYPDPDPPYTYSLHMNAGVPYFGISDGSAGSAMETDYSETIPAFAWTHLAGTYDGSYLRLYVNGIERSSVFIETDIGSGSTGLYIGRLVGRAFAGLIDEVRLWNITRDQVDIQNDMSVELTGTETGLAGYWKFNGIEEINGFQAARDYTSNNNHLIVQYNTPFVTFNPIDHHDVDAAITAHTPSIDFGTIEQAYEWKTRTIDITNGSENPLVGIMWGNISANTEGTAVMYVPPYGTESFDISLRTKDAGSLSGDIAIDYNGGSETVSATIESVPVLRFDVNQIGLWTSRTGIAGYDPFTASAGLEWPIGSGKTALYSMGIRIGALVGNEIRIAAVNYNGSEFSPGPIINGTPADPEDPIYRMYKTGGPGDGDWDVWPLDQGAPASFWGSPKLLGDQTLFSVYNDMDPGKHTVFNTAPLGVEVQQTVYGYGSGSTALENTVFFVYKIINKGSHTWENAYISVWADPDLGYYMDDFAGVDVSRGLGYLYNADNFDDPNDSNPGYGTPPPALGIDMLRGAFLSTPIQAFTYHTGIGGSAPLDDPQNAQEAYNYMQGLKSDGSPFMDGGTPTTFPLSGDPVTGTGWVDAGEADRRIMLSTGPITLKPGESRQVIAALIMAAGSDNIDSITELRNASDAVQLLFDPIVVTSAADAGNGTFRAALEEANARPGIDYIHFNISGTGVHTLQPATPYPVVMDAVIIDGKTQAGYSGTPLIEIDGSGVTGTDQRGLVIIAGNSTVRGLAINRFGQAGIVLQDNGGNTIQGNFIGTDAAGGTALGNGGFALAVGCSSNLIGGSAPGEGNLISGNGYDGIFMSDPGGDDNQVLGNIIGLDLDGQAALGNGQCGVQISNNCVNNIIGPDNIISGNVSAGVCIAGAAAANNTVLNNKIGTDISGSLAIGNLQGVNIQAPNNIVSANLISGNTSDGITLHNSDAHNNTIKGNIIGLNAAGDATLANTSVGINITGHHNTVGGSTTADRNIISGNIQNGICIELGATENNILGNYIGTDITGTKAVPNDQSGIQIRLAANNHIGGKNAGEGNLISGNDKHGIYIYGTGVTLSHSNTVQGNYIGTDKTGLKSLPNTGSGIHYATYTWGNLIGGLEPGSGNLIAFNNGAGVSFGGGGLASPPYRNAIFSNSIYANVGLGIDLNFGLDGTPYGETPNDPGDADFGTNELQNFPVLSSVEFTTDAAIINGSLNSAANTDYTIQCFACKTAHESGYGDGETLLGTETVTTDGSGNVSFTFTFPISASAGQVISMTATDPSGNTSEFSEVSGGAASQLLDLSAMTFTINSQGDPTIGDGSDITAVEAAFATWNAVSECTVNFSTVTSPDYSIADANDGINLVTFTDNEFLFAPGVLAVAAKTIRMDAAGLPAEIIDADIVYNPYWTTHYKYNFKTDTDPGYFDIQSVTTHEIGHVLGLVHSGVETATMFFMIGSDINARTLETDDMAWVRSKYPETGTYSATYGSLTGRIEDGYSSGTGIAGALVYAISEATGDSVHTYSDANGDFTIPGLLPGNYTVFVEPLDGDVCGFALRPAHISAYIYAITKITDFPEEYYSGTSEGVSEVEDIAAIVTVSAGGPAGPITILTNRDVTPPVVLSVSPGSGSTDIAVTSQILAGFSEPVDAATISASTCFLSVGPNPVNCQMDYTMMDNDKKVLLTPGILLQHETDYTLHITSGVTDLHGNGLSSEYTSTFTTIPADIEAPSVTGVVPADGAGSIFPTANITVIFSEPVDASTLEAGFTLSTANISDVPASFTLNQSGSTVTFDPVNSLMEGTTYTVTLTADITDLSGNPLSSAPYSSSFTTVAQAAPLLEYIGPNPGQDNVSVTTTVLTEFSEPINPATVNPSSFILRQGSTQIAGNFEFLNNNAGVVFRPFEDLDFGLTYTIELTSAIQDASSPPEAFAGHISTFTTAVEAQTPVIAYVNPSQGAEGTAVVISGEGFDPDPANNVVSFNGITAAVTDATLTSLAASVPISAVTGPLEVTVNGSTSNAYSFTVLQPSGFPDEYDTINVPGELDNQDVEFSPDGAYAYVTNTGANSISVIDVANGDFIGQPVSVGGSPVKITVSPDGKKAYVTNFASHTISVLNTAVPADVTVETTIPVGINPAGIAISPDGKRVYVGNYTSRNISIIDVDENSGGYNHVIANVDTDSENRDVEFGPDGLRVLITGMGIIVLDTNPSSDTYNQVIANVEPDTETRDVDFSPDGMLAVVSTMAGNILLIDMMENTASPYQVIANIHPEQEAHDVEFGPDGSHIYTTNYYYNQLSIYELTYGGDTGGSGSSYPYIASMQLLQTIDVGGAPMGLAIDSGGERIIVANSGSGGVTIIDLFGTPESNIKHTLSTIHQIQVDGFINSGQANALTNKLNNALDKLAKGKTKTAINILESFCNQVQALINDGIIPAGIGEDLMNRVKDIIVSLVSGSSASPEEENLMLTEQMPKTFSLEQNYPNPFNSSTTIAYTIPAVSAKTVDVRLILYNILGEPVRTLVSEQKYPGFYEVVWDGRDDANRDVPSGIYIYRVKAGDFTQLRKMILIK